MSKPEEDGSFKVWGFVKGDLLNTNRLAHVTGYGNFAMKEIALVEDVYALHPERLIIDQKTEKPIVIGTIDEAKWDGCE